MSGSASTAKVLALPTACRPPKGARRSRKVVREALERGEALSFGRAFNDRAHALQVERWQNATAHDLTITLVETVAYVLTDEQRARIRELAAISATRHHPLEYRAALARLVSHL